MIQENNFTLSYLVVCKKLLVLGVHGMTQRQDKRLSDPTRVEREISAIVWLQTVVVNRANCDGRASPVVWLGDLSVFDVGPIERY